MAWWRAEGNATDSIGGHAGTAGGVSYTTGKVGQAFNIPGAGSYVTIDEGTDGSAFNFTGRPFSIASWFRIAGPFTGLMGYGSIFDRMESGTGNGYRLDYSTAFNSIRLLGSISLEAPAILDFGTWYYVVAVSNGGSSAIYLNGTQIGATGTHETSNHPVPPGLVNARSPARHPSAV